jgi:hypothetical protein
MSSHQRKRVQKVLDKEQQPRVAEVEFKLREMD